MFVRSAVIVLALVVALPATVQADQRYAVDGRDTFGVPGVAVSGEITYHGVGRLSTTRVGEAVRYTTTVSYARIAGGTVTHESASFQTTLMPDGAQRDGRDDDPDDLTILNQPFAIRLDAGTLHDLRALRATVPFDFPSPLTGGTLHGSLHRLPDGLLRGIRVLGIDFTARGPLRGSLPEQPGMLLNGTITMMGRAYYAYASLLLVGLDATLEIAGEVGDRGARRPLDIVYRRTIRPVNDTGPDGESGVNAPKPRNRHSDGRG